MNIDKRTEAESLRPEPHVRRPGALARALFTAMDVVYGRQPSLQKFAALELIACVPYRAWEAVAYVALTHVQGRAGFARRVFEFVVEARAAQDNEQWHLLVMEALVAREAAPRSWWKARAIPQVLAAFYYHVSWLLYVIAPRLSYGLNADFEQHAETSYLGYLASHPELDVEPWIDPVGDSDTSVETLGALLRRIARDEREHRDHSLARIHQPRFADPGPGDLRGAPACEAA